ncbi:MAG TPA: serine hydrolase [Rhizomicrobium sp.]|nr:serine hydrolase [Rhizomicrobium sp.]
MGRWSRREAVAGLLAAGVATGVRAAPHNGDRFARLKSQFADLQLSALIVSRNGRRVYAQGNLSKPYLMHSMRKSIVNLLIGISVDKKEIDLNATLESLKLDDNPPLTDIEKTATVRDLLKARSGIYIPAAAEAPGMKARRPARGSHAPDTFWYYNNWDFNALGRIYEGLTGKSVFIALDHYLAKPLGFQDWHIFDDTYYDYEGGASEFPAYSFQLSARDLERVGSMLANDGRWNGQQIVSPSWIAESTQAYSRTNYKGALSGYGYLWWIAADDSEAAPIPKDAFTAAGAGGHYMTVIPSLKLVSVVRVDTFDPNIHSKVYDTDTFNGLLRDIIAAAA